MYLEFGIPFGKLPPAALRAGWRTRSGQAGQAFADAPNDRAEEVYTFTRNSLGRDHGDGALLDHELAAKQSPERGRGGLSRFQYILDDPA